MPPSWLARAALLATLAALPVAAAPAQGQKEEALVEQVTQRACDAVRTGDLRAIDELLAPEFTLVGSNAQVQTRGQFLAEVRRGDPKYEVFRNHSMSARVYGDAAVVQGITTLEGTSAGKPFAADVRFTDTLVRMRGHWTIVVSHVTRLASRDEETGGADAITATLSAQADRWDKAIVRKDRAAIEANMADDFRQIDGTGNVETKASFVEGLVSPDLELDPYTVEDFDVRVYGDVALLSGRSRLTGRYQGKPFTSHYRYIDVYVHGGGGWKIVSVQISRLPA